MNEQRMSDLAENLRHIGGIEKTDKVANQLGKVTKDHVEDEKSEDSCQNRSMTYVCEQV